MTLLMRYGVQALRAPLFALRAFNVETATVADAAKDAQVARIRLEWWRSAVDTIFTSQPEPHPVIEALALVPGPFCASFPSSRRARPSAAFATVWLA